MKSLVYFVLLTLCCAVNAQSASVFSYPVAHSAERRDQLASIAKQLRDQLPVSGSVIQQKHLKVLQQPLVSKGSFALRENGDILWRTNTPFSITYRFKNAVLTRTLEGKSETIALADEPALYGFFQLFSRLFELDLTQLQDYFAVYLQPAKHSWLLGLTPRDARLKKALAHIVVQGNARGITRVTLTEPNKDYTELMFSYPDAPASEPHS